MPYNESIHEHLLSLGYTYSRVEDETTIFDTIILGHDEYASNEDYILIDKEGHFDSFEDRFLALEDWVESLGTIVIVKK